MPRTRKEVVITKQGCPAEPLSPEQCTPPLLGRMKGTIEIRGDIVAPTGEKWDADELNRKSVS
jgi:hypothetical protein